MPGQKNRLCLVAVKEQSPELLAGLVRSGFTCTMAADRDEALKQIAEQTPDLVVVAVNGHLESGKRYEVFLLYQDLNRLYQAL